MGWWDEMMAKMKMADAEAKERLYDEENGYVKPKRRFYDCDESYEVRMKPYNERQRIENARKRREEIEEYKMLYDKAFRLIARMEFEEAETLIHDLDNYPEYDYTEVGTRSLIWLKHKFSVQKEKYENWCYRE